MVQVITLPRERTVGEALAQGLGAGFLKFSERIAEREKEKRQLNTALAKMLIGEQVKNLMDPGRQIESLKLNIAKNLGTKDYQHYILHGKLPSPADKITDELVDALQQGDVDRIHALRNSLRLLKGKRTLEEEEAFFEEKERFKTREAGLRARERERAKVEARKELLPTLADIEKTLAEVKAGVKLTYAPRFVTAKNLADLAFNEKYQDRLLKLKGDEKEELTRRVTEARIKVEDLYKDTLAAIKRKIAAGRIRGKADAIKELTALKRLLTTAGLEATTEFKKEHADELAKIKETIDRAGLQRGVLESAWKIMMTGYLLAEKTNSMTHLQETMKVVDQLLRMGGFKGVKDIGKVSRLPFRDRPPALDLEEREGQIGPLVAPPEGYILDQD
jgi:hypothetical protein